MHMAMFLLPKFEIHSLEKKMPWTLTLAHCRLLTDLWPGALDPWPLTHEQSTLSPEPWALARVQELSAPLTKMMQSCPNRKISWTFIEFLQVPRLSWTYGHVFAIQILDYITWTLGLALIPEPWSWSMTPDPCPKSCNHRKIAWIHVIIMYFQRKIIEWMENCLTQYKKHWFSMWHIQTP